jgi:hypothetical protein
LPLQQIPPTEAPTEEPTATEVPTEEPTATEEATEAPTEAAEATATEEAPAATGSIRINLTDPDTNVLIGACFSVTSDAASGEVCDNDTGDQEPAEGIIEIGSLPVGEYLVS